LDWLTDQLKDTVCAIRRMKRFFLHQIKSQVMDQKFEPLAHFEGVFQSYSPGQEPMAEK
jgi:hypothetical protein